MSDIDPTTQREANEKIAAILKQIDALYAEAEAIADAAQVQFYTGGPEYGMGGYYQPRTPRTDGSDEGWHSSSSSC